MTFDQALQHLRQGDFTLLDPQFESGQVQSWFQEGRFQNHPDELNEALACACFNGRLETAQLLLEAGVDPLAGKGTGLDAFHWAANRGKLEVVQLLLARGTSTESISHYGANVLGTAIWSELNEKGDSRLPVIEALLSAGASAEHSGLSELGFPTPNEALNETLKRHGVV